MNFRCLRAFAFLILAFSTSAYAQSLGDFARQVRAERQQSTTPHAKIITNDDIAPAKHDSTPPNQASHNGAKNEGEVPATAADRGTDAKGETGDPTNGKSSKAPKDAAKNPANNREAQEIETEKRTKEINQSYLDRIATLHTNIDAAQSGLARLQRDQMESTNEFRRTLGVSPNPATYEQQQRVLTDQVVAQRDLIQSLNSQLEDALESARHAGVPHASD